MLLGYNFEPRQNNQESCWYSGLSYNHWFIKTRKDLFHSAPLTCDRLKKKEKYKYIYISKE